MKSIMAAILAVLAIFSGSSAAAGQKTAPESSSGAVTAGTQRKLDVNRATEAELLSVPGIGPRMAQAIIDLRTTKGAFSTIEGLLQVRGIKEKTLKSLSAFLEVLPVQSAAGITTPR